MAGSHQQLLTAAALLGVTGRPESHIGRIFRGCGAVLMVFDACVAADTVASPSSSPAAGSDLCATSAPPSLCTYMSPQSASTKAILESNAPSCPPLACVLAVEKIPIAQAAVVALSCYVGQSMCGFEEQLSVSSRTTSTSRSSTVIIDEGDHFLRHKVRGRRQAQTR